MIEDYINNFELEFPVYEAVQKRDFIYYGKPSDTLTEMWRVSESLSKHDNPHQMLKNPILNSINKKRFKHMTSYFRTDAIPKR